MKKVQYARAIGGIDVHLRQPILRAVKKQSEDFTALSVDDIDRVLRLGAASDDYTLRAGGYEVDIAPLVAKHTERYAGWIANNIADGVFNGFRGVKSVILVGGGATLVEDSLRQWYGDKVLNRKKHPSVRRLHPVDMNAVGGLRFALLRMKQAGAG